MNKRLTSVNNWMKEQNIEVTFLNSKENVYYLSSFYTDPHERLMGIFIFKEEQPLFVLPKMEVNQLKNAGWEFDIIGYSDHEDPWKLIEEFIQAREVTNILLHLKQKS